jgi:hypothetical protein
MHEQHLTFGPNHDQLAITATQSVLRLFTQCDRLSAKY